MKRSVFSRPYLPLIRWPERLWKGMAWVVIVCFVVNALTPAVVAARTLEHNAALNAPPVKSELEMASDALVSLEDTLDRMDRRLNGRFEFAWQETLAKKKSSMQPQAMASRAQLAAQELVMVNARAQFDALQPAVQGYFAQTKAHLADKGIDASIVARQQAQTDTYARMSGMLKGLLQAVGGAKSEADYRAAVAAAAAFLREHSSKPKRAAFDPEHLAFGPPTTRARAPLTSAAEIRKALKLPEEAASTKAGIKTNDTSSKNAKADGKSTADVPANLAPTEDVQITPAIQAKATELGNNPLKLYQFVRNNVEYMPTYGSIQGSDYTLQTLHGNDMDQASLLIALLRASNIPSRYVYGTIQVPIEQAMNWVGGVTDPNAALDLLGQGGVPNLGLAEGGKIKFVQMEHVWVEAQIPFAPGRGATSGGELSWMAMDPSFKQYTYTQGMNIAQAVPFDRQTFMTTLAQGATINSKEGWVRNLNAAYVQSYSDTYEASLKSFIAAQNPDATIADVVGKKTLVLEVGKLLAGSLPYHFSSSVVRMDSLAPNLRWAFRLLIDGSEAINRSLPALAGHSMALSFTPMTVEDENLLLSYVPANSSLDNLPASLPAGLVRLISNFSIDEHSVATSGVYALGDEVTVSKGLYRPGEGWSEEDKFVAAGDYQAVALAGASISQTEISRLQTEVAATASSIEAGRFEEITKHNLFGATYQSGLRGLFASLNMKYLAGGRQNAVVYYPMPSFGTLSLSSGVAVMFGVPISYKPDGALMDIERVAVIDVDKQGNAKNLSVYNQTCGNLLSDSEHAVLESLYPEMGQAPVEALSAVKTLAIASQQGQAIYNIESGNVATALSAIEVDNEIKSEISDAINAGLTVTASQSSVTYANQTTFAYIVQDPTTGAGAYKIAGNADGGKLAMVTHGLLLLDALVAMVVKEVLGAGIRLAVLANPLIAEALLLALTTATVFLGLAAAAALAGESDLAVRLCSTAVNMLFTALGLLLPGPEQVALKIVGTLMLGQAVGNVFSGEGCSPAHPPPSMRK